MQLSPAFVEQLRSRITLSEVVGKQVRLIHKTGGNYSGLCPFHQEKTPSFTVSNEKGFYHCFGCGAHGDVFAFVMAKEGLGFAETVVRLAEQMGMPLPVQDKREQERADKTTSLYQVMESASQWYEQQLFTPAGREALAYFKRRGVSREALTQFRLGFAPDNRHGLIQHLKGQGISESQLLEAGLIIRPEQGESYDRFRGRIMFPIMDVRGRVIAFGGRILHEGQPKYLNSPETLLFKKSDVLYAEHLARKPAYETGQLVAVEGYMDVIALHMAGITTAVAPLGTALTEQHLRRLWNYVKEPVICLDGDSAGKRAMMRIAVQSLPLLKDGVSLRFALLPQGQDPDEVVKKQGVGFMERLLASAQPLSEMLWESEYNQKPLVTPEQKAAFERHMMQYAATITDTQLQGYYRRYFAAKIWEQIKRAGGGRERLVVKVQPATAMPEKLSPIQHCECTIMALILRYSQLLNRAEVEDMFVQLDFTRKDLEKIRMVILELKNAESSANEQEGIKDFRLHLEKAGFSDNIEYLCGNPHFLGNITAETEKEILTLWRYAVDKYHLSLMQEEHRLALAEMTETSEKKAAAYYSQIVALEKNIFETEQLLLSKE